MDVASQGQEDLGPLPRGWAIGAGLAGSKSLQVPSFPPPLSLIHTIDVAMRCVLAERAWENLGVSQNGAAGAREGVLAGGREDRAAEGGLEPGRESTFSVGAEQRQAGCPSAPQLPEAPRATTWDQTPSTQAWVGFISAAARGSQGHNLGPDTIHSGLGGIYSPLELRHLPGKQQRKNTERTGGKRLIHIKCI